MYRNEVNEHEEFFIGIWNERGQMKPTEQGIDDFKAVFDAEGALKPEYMDCIGRYMIHMTPPCYSDVCRLFYASEMQRITGINARRMWDTAVRR